MDHMDMREPSDTDDHQTQGAGRQKGGQAAFNFGRANALAHATNNCVHLSSLTQGGPAPPGRGCFMAKSIWQIHRHAIAKAGQVHYNESDGAVLSR